MPFPHSFSGKNAYLKISFILIEWHLPCPLPWGNDGCVKCALRGADTEAELRMQEDDWGVTLVKIKKKNRGWVEKAGLDRASDQNADLSKFWSTQWGIPEQRLLTKGVPC